jgi:hypothetical protein
MREDSKFKEDFEGCLPAAHEKASAVLVLKRFKKELKVLGANPYLVARMILGCTHTNTLNRTMKLENAIIQLLNGRAIDVDKLDYIVRDTWASGVNNTSIDMHRLLASVVVVDNIDGFPTLAFRKSALSVVRSVVDGRNFLYQWIYAHHKVVYDKHLLTTAVRKLSKILSDRARKGDDAFLDAFFSIDALLGRVDFDDMSFRLPVDGDLIYLLKKEMDGRPGIPEAREWMSRQHRLKPIWKTYAEFWYLFGGFIRRGGEKESDKRLRQMRESALKCCPNFMKKKKFPKGIEVLDGKVRLVELLHNELFIEVEGKLVSYDDMFGEHSGSSQLEHYLLQQANLNRRLLQEKIRNLRYFVV